MTVAGTGGTTGAFTRAIAILLALWAWTAAVPGHAVQIDSESGQKAAFVLRFAGFVEWPPGADSEIFRIAVLGDTAVAGDLEELADGRQVGGRPVRVSRVTSVSAARDAQVLVVGSAHGPRLHDLLEPLAGHSVLVVTAENGALAAGSAINFLQHEDRVRFEVSLPAARRMGLRVSSELLSVAARVER